MILFDQGERHKNKQEQPQLDVQIKVVLLVIANPPPLRKPPFSVARTSSLALPVALVPKKLPAECSFCDAQDGHDNGCLPYPHQLCHDKRRFVMTNKNLS